DGVDARPRERAAHAARCAVGRAAADDAQRGGDVRGRAGDRERRARDHRRIARHGEAERRADPALRGRSRGPRGPGQRPRGPRARLRRDHRDRGDDRRGWHQAWCPCDGPRQTQEALGGPAGATETPPEGLTRIAAAALGALLLVALSPRDALAWTPGTHILLGEALIRSAELLLPASLASL